MRKILRGAKIIDCMNPKPLEGCDLIIKEGKNQSISKKAIYDLLDDEVLDLSAKQYFLD